MAKPRWGYPWTSQGDETIILEAGKTGLKPGLLDSSDSVEQELYVALI